MSDLIRISRLRLETLLGVPDAERAAPQAFLVSVEIGLDHGSVSAGRRDNLSQTVDYAAVADALRGVAADRPRKLIEALAEDLADAVLRFRGVAGVVVTLEKFILPDAESVGLRIERRKGSSLS